MAVESVALALRFDPSRLVQVEQVHGDRVLTVPVPRGAKGDALVATQPGDAVGVRVADCVPILLADPKTRIVAAVHAGWRGVVAGIVTRTLEQIAPSSGCLIAAIGPCIGPCCFEVGLDVAEKIGAIDCSAVARQEGDKAFVDLRRAVRMQLRGVAAIEDVPSSGRAGCTKCDAEQFFSHRRDGDHAGRHLAVIVAG
jgi:YfiH family protein